MGEPQSIAALDTYDGSEDLEVDGEICLEQQVGKISLSSLQQQLGKVSLRPVALHEHESPGAHAGVRRVDPPLAQRSKSVEEAKHNRVITQQPHVRSKSLEHPSQKRSPFQSQKLPACREDHPPVDARQQQQQQHRSRQQRGRSMSLTSLTFVKMRKLFTFRRRTRSLRVKPMVRQPK